MKRPATTFHRFGLTALLMTGGLLASAPASAQMQVPEEYGHLIITDQSYNGAEWWGTVTVRNNGTATVRRFVVALRLPEGVHCTAEPESVPAGATLTPLAGMSSPDRTVSNVCYFNFESRSIAPGQELTFNYSADSQHFSAAEYAQVADRTTYGVTCNAFTVTKNVYNGSQWWGTIAFRNEGPQPSGNHKVEFDVPSGVHCTNDYVPPGAVLSPLNGTGRSARTVSNHCVFTWTNAPPLNVGATKWFNYSTDSQRFSAAKNVKVSDPSTCSGGMCHVAGHECNVAEPSKCCSLACLCPLGQEICTCG